MAFKALEQAYDMQDFAYDASMALREQLTQDSKVRAPDKEQAAIIGTLGKVWKDAQEQIRIHRGKPLPGSLTHEKVRSPRAKRTATLGASMLASLVAEQTGAAGAEQQPQAEQSTPTPTSPPADPAP